MLPHDWLDCLSGFVGMVEWNSADIMVQDVGFNDAVEQVSTNKAEFTINCRRGAASEGPSVGRIVWQGRISVLEVGNRNW